MDSIKERLVNRLISSLTDKSAQERIFDLSYVLPARAVALSELTLDPPELLEVENSVLQTGRSYRSYPIWVRIQNDLMRVFDNITEEFLDGPHNNILPITQKHIDPVVQCYSMILSAM